LQQALEFLDEYQEDCKIICGGQSLLILMRQGLVAPEYLIDIKRVDDLNYITFDEQNGLRIGATTTHRTIERSAVVHEHYPAIVEMEENLASIQTRTWGTIGGNLAHGDPAGCPAPLLIALNATVKLASKSGERMVPVEDFSIDYFETDLNEGEMLLEIQVPPMPTRTVARYEKFNIIKNDQGTVNCAVAISLDKAGATCTDARIVVGAAGPIPLRITDAEQMLIGQSLNDELLEALGQKASEAVEPVSDIHGTAEYRRRLAAVLTKKNVQQVWKDAITVA
jgi:carbon-monoxide dehydrogenase medium subunit